MKPVIFSLAILLALSSCKNTSVSGTVYDKNNIAIPNVLIILKTYEVNNPKYYDQVAEVSKTDASGNYYFKFYSKVMGYDYRVSCYTDSSFASSNIKKFKSNKIDLYLQ